MVVVFNSYVDHWQHDGTQCYFLIAKISHQPPRTGLAERVNSVATHTSRHSLAFRAVYHSAPHGKVEEKRRRYTRCEARCANDHVQENIESPVDLTTYLNLAI